MAGPVRQPIDLKALESWLDKQVPQIKTPLELKQFGFGQSNPTYQIVSVDGTKYVMRKKPPGKLLSRTAHRVDREFRVIYALENTNVPVPKAYCLCEDDTIIGSAFYIMEFLDGRMITDPLFPDVSPEHRREMWHDAIRTLAEFHKVIPKDVGLETFGQPANFYDRQIRTFEMISKAQAEAVDIESKKPVGDIPYFKEMVSYFKDKARQPKDKSTLVHGDYKIDNLVFHKTEPRVIGVLDWEMATVGHPLSDLVNLITPLSGTKKIDHSPSGQEAVKGETSNQSNEFIDKLPLGLPTIEQAVKWYTEESGYEPGLELSWGNAFGNFRTAVIMQGIVARYALRQASGITAKTFGSQLGPYSEGVWSQIEALKAHQHENAKL